MMGRIKQELLWIFIVFIAKTYARKLSYIQLLIHKFLRLIGGVVLLHFGDIDMLI